MPRGNKHDDGGRARRYDSRDRDRERQRERSVRRNRGERDNSRAGAHKRQDSRGYGRAGRRDREDSRGRGRAVRRSRADSRGRAEHQERKHHHERGERDRGRNRDEERGGERGRTRGVRDDSRRKYAQGRRSTWDSERHAGRVSTGGSDRKQTPLELVPLSPGRRAGLGLAKKGSKRVYAKDVELPQQEQGHAGEDANAPSMELAREATDDEESPTARMKAKMRRVERTSAAHDEDRASARGVVADAQAHVVQDVLPAQKNTTETAVAAPSAKKRTAVSDGAEVMHVGQSVRVHRELRRREGAKSCGLAARDEDEILGQNAAHASAAPGGAGDASAARGSTNKSAVAALQRVKAAAGAPIVSSGVEGALVVQKSMKKIAATAPQQASKTRDNATNEQGAAHKKITMQSKCKEAVASAGKSAKRGADKKQAVAPKVSMKRSSGVELAARDEEDIFKATAVKKAAMKVARVGKSTQIEQPRRGSAPATPAGTATGMAQRAHARLMVGAGRPVRKTYPEKTQKGLWAAADAKKWDIASLTLHRSLLSVLTEQPPEYRKERAHFTVSERQLIDELKRPFRYYRQTYDAGGDAVAYGRAAFTRRGAARMAAQAMGRFLQREGIASCPQHVLIPHKRDRPYEDLPLPAERALAMSQSGLDIKNLMSEDEDSDPDGDDGTDHEPNEGSDPGAGGDEDREFSKKGSDPDGDGGADHELNEEGPDLGGADGDADHELNAESGGGDVSCRDSWKPGAKAVNTTAAADSSIPFGARKSRTGKRVMQDCILADADVSVTAWSEDSAAKERDGRDQSPGSVEQSYADKRAQDEVQVISSSSSDEHEQEQEARPGQVTPNNDVQQIIVGAEGGDKDVSAPHAGLSPDNRRKRLSEVNRELQLLPECADQQEERIVVAPRVLRKGCGQGKYSHTHEEVGKGAVCGKDSGESCEQRHGLPRAAVTFGEFDARLPTEHEKDVSFRVTWLTRHCMTIGRTKEGFVSPQDMLDWEPNKEEQAYLDRFAKKNHREGKPVGKMTASLMRGVSIIHLMRIVWHDKKARFNCRLFEDGLYWIRAAQGHDGRVARGLNLGLTSLSEDDLRTRYPVFLHGTSSAAWSLIQKDGFLRKMTRHAVHMAKSWDEIAALKRRSEVVLQIDALAATQQLGLIFQVALNGVLLCEGPIPIQFVKQVKGNHESPEGQGTTNGAVTTATGNSPAAVKSEFSAANESVVRTTLQDFLGNAGEHGAAAAPAGTRQALTETSADRTSHVQLNAVSAQVPDTVSSRASRGDEDAVLRTLRDTLDAATGEGSKPASERKSSSRPGGGGVHAEEPSAEESVSLQEKLLVFARKAEERFGVFAKNADERYAALSSGINKRLSELQQRFDEQNAAMRREIEEWRKHTVGLSVDADKRIAQQWSSTLSAIRGYESKSSAFATALVKDANVNWSNAMAKCKKECEALVLEEAQHRRYHDKLEQDLRLAGCKALSERIEALRVGQPVTSAPKTSGSAAKSTASVANPSASATAVGTAKSAARKR